MDTIARAVTVSTWGDALESPVPTSVLAGTASNGSGVSELYVRSESPQGEIFWDTLDLNGGDWQFTLVPTSRGV